MSWNPIAFVLLTVRTFWKCKFQNWNDRDAFLDDYQFPKRSRSPAFRERHLFPFENLFVAFLKQSLHSSIYFLASKFKRKENLSLERTNQFLTLAAWNKSSPYFCSRPSRDVQLCSGSQALLMSSETSTVDSWYNTTARQKPGAGPNPQLMTVCVYAWFYYR